MEELKYLTGYVKTINKNKGYFTLYSPDDQKTYRIADLSLPLRSGDVVSGYSSIRQVKKTSMATFLKAPLVLVSRAEKIIKPEIIKILGVKTGLKLYQHFEEEFRDPQVKKCIKDDISKIMKSKEEDTLPYQKFLHQLNTHEDLFVENINNLVEKWYYGSDYVRETLIDSYTKKVLECSPEEIRKFFHWWIDNRSLRQLQLLSLTTKEIWDISQHHDYYPSQIIRMCLSQPYKLIPLTLERCHKIVSDLQLTIQPEDIEGGKLSRFLYSYLQRGSSGVPLSWVSANFSNYLSLMKSYDLHLDNNLVYLPEPYALEVSLGKYLKDLISREALSLIYGNFWTNRDKVLKSFTQNLQAQGKKCLFVYLSPRLREYPRLRAQGILLPDLLNINPETYAMKKEDYLIVMDAPLWGIPDLHKLLDYFKNVPQLLLFGDVHYLHPPSWGHPFETLRMCEGIMSYEVTEGENDKIPHLIDNVKRMIGIYHPDSLPEEINDDGPFTFSPGGEFKVAEGNLETISLLLPKLLEVGIERDSLILLTPYQGDVHPLNQICQKSYLTPFDNNALTDPQGNVWRLNDRVMMKRKKKPLHRGEEGRIIEIIETQIRVLFSQGRRDLFDHTEAASYLVHAFAMTISQAQGGQWDNVLLYCPPKINMEKVWEGDLQLTKFLNQNLLYTAFSLCRRRFWAIGDLLTLQTAGTQLPPKRWDGLLKRLE